MKRKTESKIVRGRKKTKKKRIKNTEDIEKRTWKQWIFILIFIVFVGTVLYVFLCSSLDKIVEINVTGNNRVANESLQNRVKDVIEGNIVGCISKNNYFFVNQKEIINKLLEDKRIKEVKIKKQFPHSINIDIVEHGTIVVWCLSDVNGKCFILDGDHATSEVKMGDDILLNNNHFVVVDESGEEVNIGDRIIDEKYLETIEFLGKEFIYSINVGVNEPYKIVSRGSNEVRFNTDEDWYIVVDVTQDVDEILSVIKLFMKKVELPSRRHDLEYVDMRFPEKLFYKMKEGVEQVEEEKKVSEENADNEEKDKESNDK